MDGASERSPTKQRGHTAPRHLAVKTSVNRMSHTKQEKRNRRTVEEK